MLETRRAQWKCRTSTWARSFRSQCSVRMIGCLMWPDWCQKLLVLRLACWWWLQCSVKSLAAGPILPLASLRRTARRWHKDKPGWGNCSTLKKCQRWGTLQAPCWSSDRPCNNKTWRKHSTAKCWPCKERTLLNLRKASPCWFSSCDYLPWGLIEFFGSRSQGKRRRWVPWCRRSTSTRIVCG